LAGQIPNVSGIVCLETLNFSGNQLNTTNGPQVFATQSCLTTMDLSNNKFSGPPPNLTTMSLQYLDLSNNKFFGPPPNLTTMPLQYLDLSMNQFHGPIIFESIFNIQTSNNLTVLDLSQNNFTGPLPDISLFSGSLQQLDLSDNFFDPQQVPTWRAEFHQLQTLALRGCNLFGSFPYEVASLSQLQSINLENNNFNGTLAIENISSLKITPDGSDKRHLKYVNITNNNISNVEYDDVDILVVFTSIMLGNNPYCSGSLQTNGQRCYCSQNCSIIFGDSNKNNIEVILISTLVSGSVLTLVIVITIYLFWRSKQKQRRLLLQIHESKSICPCKVKFCPK
jgi:uncharacterized protein YjbI with pentapeptide repeats